MSVWNYAPTTKVTHRPLLLRLLVTCTLLLTMC